ncbi:MAG: YceI family protein [Thiomonas sp.]
MKAFRLASTLLGALVLTTSGMSAARAAPQTYEIDPEHFSIGFQVQHVGYASVIGLFLEASGQFVYDEETRRLSSGRVVVAADSVFTNHKKRDGHLRDRDFLQARRYPEIVFEAGKFTSGENNTGKLEGTLTLRGETRPVVLDVTLNKAASYPFGHRKHTLGISARTTLLRSEWGMDYAVKGDMVSDRVEMRFELEAVRQ